MSFAASNPIHVMRYRLLLKLFEAGYISKLHRMKFFLDQVVECNLVLHLIKWWTDSECLLMESASTHRKKNSVKMTILSIVVTIYCLFCIGFCNGDSI